MRPNPLQTHALEQFQKADWKRLPLELTHYAIQKVNRLRWRTSQGLPRGLLPQDLAMQAIQKTLEGLTTPEVSGRGIRKWDPSKDPSLLNFLRSVIDSDVSSLVNLDEHKLTNYSADAPGDEANQRLERSINHSSHSEWRESKTHFIQPDLALLEKENSTSSSFLYEQMMAVLETQCATDPHEHLVLKTMRDLIEDQDTDIKPAELVKRTGLKTEEVRNAKRRIERRTRQIRSRLTHGDTQDGAHSAQTLIPKGNSYDVHPSVG